MSTLRVHSVYVSYICPTLNMAQTETVPSENITRNYEISEDDIYNPGQVISVETEIVVTKCVCGVMHTFVNEGL